MPANLALSLRLSCTFDATAKAETMFPEKQRSLTILTSTVVTAVIVVVLYTARSIFIPVALALFVAFVLSPVVTRLHHRGLGRTPAVLVTVGAVLLIVAAVSTLITQQVLSLAETLPDQKEAIKAKVLAAKHWLVGGGTGRFASLVQDLGEVISPTPHPAPTQSMQKVVVEPAPETLTSQVQTYFSPAAEVLGQAAFVFILALYILLKKEDIRNRFIRLIGDGTVTRTTKAVDDASSRISRYLLMQATINTSFGLFIACGLFLLGVNYAILWGTIASIMRYVPYLGTPIGLIPPVLFSFATAPAWGGGWGQPLCVLALFVVSEVICNNVFEPWLYGRSMGVSEVAQIVSAGFWAFLWGPIGIILSGPILVCLLVLGRHVRQFQFLAVLLGDQPALTPQVAFFQRLAARDQDEASDVAMKVARESGPDAALETVVVPALALARRELHEGDLNEADFDYAVHAAREVVAELRESRGAPENEGSGERVRLLIVPSRDEAEQVAAEALAATLDHTRWEVRVAGHETLASELVDEVAEFDPAVVVVVAIPPGGRSHCRYIVSRLHGKFPGIRVLVARLNCEVEVVEEESKGGLPGVEGVDDCLSETRKRLAGLLPVLSAAEDKHAAAKADRKLVGTVGA
ncbi:MAG TPA: AI-2E family transporter [Gemmata sp.]|nr:AI-2E family transporter [Gemmata sp.]